MKLQNVRFLIVTSISFTFPVNVKCFVGLKATANSGPLSSKSSNDNGEKDPTKVWTAEIADAIQNAVTYSPLNEGKKALVKMLAGDYDSPVVRNKLIGLIKEEPVLMLSFVKWPFCVKAKALLDTKNVSYTVIEVDEVVDGKAIRAEMAELFGRTSVPAIWIGGRFVGGCNDGPMGGIMKLEEKGELDVLLEDVASS